jgi:hypothetical protein
MDKKEDKYAKDKILNKVIPFFELFDLDRENSFLLLSLWRLFCTLTFTKMLINPDELY